LMPLVNRRFGLLLVLALGISSQQLMLPKAALAEDMTKTIFKQADSAEIHGDNAGSIKLYLHLIDTIGKSDPTSPRILRARARIARLHLLEHEYDKATPYVKSILIAPQSRVSEDPELMVDIDDLSDAYLRYQKDPVNGYNSLVRSYKLRCFINPKHPHLPETYQSFARYEQAHGNFDKAIEWLQKAVAIESTYPPQKLERYVHDMTMIYAIYQQKGDNKAAESVMRDCLAVCVKSKCADYLKGQTYLNIGYALMKQKQYEKADENFKLAGENLKSCPPQYSYICSVLEARVRENNAWRTKPAGKKAGT